MSHQVVKILIDDDGEKIPRSEQKWHLLIFTDDNRTFCTGEAIGFGSSAGTSKIKTVNKGGVTCPDCLASIKEIKQIKL